MFHLTDENEIAIFDIIGAAMDVHSELKCGLLEQETNEIMFYKKYKEQHSQDI